MRESLLKTIYDKDFLSGLRPDVSDAHRHIQRILLDVDDWSVTQQTKFEQRLHIAQSHRALDEDSIRRLRSPNPVSFWGKFNEYAVAEKLISAGGELKFSPPGRDKHEGEFLLGINGTDIFVEVKTMFPKPADEREDRHLTRLTFAASEVDVPAWIILQVMRVPRTDPALGPFRAFLQSTVPELASAPEGERSAIYSDEDSGLQAVVAYQMTLESGGIEASPFSGMRPLTEDASVKASLKKAYTQLREDLPNLVVLCSRLHFPPSPRLIRDALYGTTQWHVQVSDMRSKRESLPVQVSRLDNGFFAKCLNSRISAVAIADELQEKYNPNFELVMHHHPCPRMQISPEALAPISRRQELAERISSEEGDRLRLIRPFDAPWPRWDRDGDEDDSD